MSVKNRIMCFSNKISLFRNREADLILFEENLGKQQGMCLYCGCFSGQY